ncbi:DeoR/GlpR family DNA-binding transcription regulator [Streptomyces sp. MP131-18]|uniref:DeoR/GlpR family DNA-binding transcription regulator n=1 Tax=Streptomyces sp. MP131-18 TaxID=1857892 RepID=UPI00097BCCC4|nr:DeoR/GlpR family DNA-binding transcription regulator [Streptomyces sp. MP131-18]ONK09873.1 Glycerol-3-phosphate regulon repressor [Streptomyces sp. MP131-18]
MLPAERHRRITATVNQAGTLSTEALAAELGVSAETVRRDLAQLESRGVLSRVHGGAAALAVARGLTGEEAPFAERSAAQADAKAAIGRAAAALVRPGMTVVIDVGTTAVQVARALPADFRGLVATSSLLVAGELAGRPQVEVLIPGGRVRGGDLVCSGAQAVAFFSGLHADVAFLGSGGVDAEAGVTDFYFDEIATKRAVIPRSVRAYVLADTSKHGRIAPHRVCGLDECAGVITEPSAEPELAAAVSRAGGTVITA